MHGTRRHEGGYDAGTLNHGPSPERTVMAMNASLLLPEPTRSTLNLAFFREDENEGGNRAIREDVLFRLLKETSEIPDALKRVC